MNAYGAITVITDDPMATRYRIVFDDMTDGDVTALAIILRRARIIDDTPTPARFTQLASDAIREMLAP